MKPKILRGVASALPDSIWKLWLKWLKDFAGCRTFFAVFLTGAFGLRMGEALCLKREEINLDRAIPTVTISGEVPGGRKSPGDVYVRKQHFKTLKQYLEKGIQSVRTRKHKHGKGLAKTIDFNDNFYIPSKGFIFTSRKNAKQPHLHYQAMYAHIRRQCTPFMQAMTKQGTPWCKEWSRLRGHSGRATLITQLMGEGMPIALSMKYARHAAGSYRIHLKYCRHTLADVKKACDTSPSAMPRIQKRNWATMNTSQLLRCQREITTELSRRQ